jgi:hypothetical protein
LDHNGDIGFGGCSLIHKVRFIQLGDALDCFRCNTLSNSNNHPAMALVYDAHLESMGLDMQNTFQIPDSVAVQSIDFHFFAGLQPFQATGDFQ